MFPYVEWGLKRNDFAGYRWNAGAKSVSWIREKNWPTALWNLTMRVASSCRSASVRWSLVSGAIRLRLFRLGCFCLALSIFLCLAGSIASPHFGCGTALGAGQEMPVGSERGGQAAEGSSGWDDPRPGYLVDVDLPLVGDRDERVRQQVVQIANSQSGGGRPIVVLRFQASPLAELAGEPDNGGMRTRGSQFERCLSLARFLTSSDAARVRLVAYVPETVEGHAVLPVLACEEIIASPTAELGRSAIDEPTDETIEAAYRDVVRRRATLPEAVAMAMLDATREVYAIELTDGASTVVGREEAVRLRNQGRVLREETLWQGGALAIFTGQQMRSRRWIPRTVSDETQLTSVLGLVGSLRTTRQLPREWKPVSITLSSSLNQTRVNQIVRGLNEQVDEDGVNLVVLQVDQTECDFQQASRLANFIADLDADKVYTLSLVREPLRGPICLIPVACREAVLLPLADLGADSQHSVALMRDDSAQRFLGDFSERTNRPLSLLSVLVDVDAKVQEFIHQKNGRRSIFADWQVAAQADADQWLAKRTLAGRDPIKPEVALQYRLVDSIDDTAAIALSRLGLQEIPEELATPWLDSSIQMLLSQGWLPRLLLTIGFFALMAELGNPGIGAGGFLSALCFLGFFWIEGLNGNVEWLEILLFVAGLVALAVEVFVLPGFGLFGIGGLLMVFVSVVLASQTFIWPTTSTQLSEVASNLFWTACLALAGMIGLLFMHKQLERLPMLKWVTLQPEEDPEDLHFRESMAHRDHLLGQEGLTTTRLNPSGKAQFGNHIVPVVGSGKLIGEGVPVRVVEVRGNLVLVEELRGGQV